jgi:phosphatidylglycerophosphate synthase
MLTLPNLLTLSRILAVPILVFLLWRPSWWDYGITFILYCLVGITDYFDGYLARAQGTVSRLGQFLDPIADKIMVVAVIAMLVTTRQPAPVPTPNQISEPIIYGFHLIPALVILLREITVSGLREFLAGLQVSVPVSALAKWKTALQMFALGALILSGALPQWPWVHQVGIVSLWGAAALTVVTGWDYLRVGIRHMD